MNRLAIVASLIGLSVAGCGKGGTPCTGSTCLQVAGTYNVTVTQGATSSCKYIVYGSGFTDIATITQTGSALTLAWTGSPVAETATGTLDTDNSASFTTSGMINVIDDEGNAYPYEDTDSVSLTFVPSGGMVTFTGQVSDSLTANPASPSGIPDPSCILVGTVSGSP